MAKMDLESIVREEEKRLGWDANIEIEEVTEREFPEFPEFNFSYGIVNVSSTVIGGIVFFLLVDERHRGEIINSLNPDFTDGAQLLFHKIGPPGNNYHYDKIENESIFFPIVNLPINNKEDDEKRARQLQESIKEYEVFIEKTIEEMKQAKAVLESNPDIGEIQDSQGLAVTIRNSGIIDHADSPTFRFLHKPSMEYKELTVKAILSL